MSQRSNHFLVILSQLFAHLFQDVTNTAIVYLPVHTWTQDQYNSQQWRFLFVYMYANAANTVPKVQTLTTDSHHLGLYAFPLFS